MTNSLSFRIGHGKFKSSNGADGTLHRVHASFHRPEDVPRVHEPWKLAPLDLKVLDHGLLAQTGSWFRSAQYVDASYSPGVDVWMGRPLRLDS